jgi:hypothetical protein
MSDRMRVMRTVALACALAYALIAPSLGAQSAFAPSAELQRLRMDADSADARRLRALEEFRRAQREERELTDTSWVDAGRVRVLISPAVLSDAERDRVREGIERALDSLDARFGEDALKMIDTSRPWTIAGTAGFLSGLKPANATSRAFGPQGMQHHLRRPVSDAALESFALRQAGRALGRAVPSLATYVGENATFARDDGRWETAARELALSYSTAARLCHGGDVAQCRRVLTPAGPREALDQWFVPADYRAVVTASSMDIAPSDTVNLASWGRCKAGADSACTRLALRIPVRDPFSGNLRGTFVSYALEVGEPGMPERMRADSTTRDPVELLARAAGMPADSLIAGWQRRTSRALDDAIVPAVPVVFSTAAWGLLLLGVASRKRPS